MAVTNWQWMHSSSTTTTTTPTTNKYQDHDSNTKTPDETEKERTESHKQANQKKGDSKSSRFSTPDINKDAIKYEKIFYYTKRSPEQLFMLAIPYSTQIV